MDGLDNPARRAVDGLDSAKVAGLLVVAALLVLGSLRKGFAGVRVNLGD